ncbi:PRD domain-containing protein [Microbacterium thalassium]|uniref:Beta-glucoside operon transcriptional antiterminator n=1 Tax=Microbacterium thalassium TaxID=362649 RepID=A0A7X0KU44_9MICO|nr:PRD domain-containing protein [Microbacterium thalassium]MBB6390780.1 beta-glucoside operon transcriptional antiterminator [Microbacterium thalassium]GLK25888.1 transcription antiterminator LicT [Microbacterium thalassium]
MGSRREEPHGAGVVHKVLNNNVVVSAGITGSEVVLMGRGLGFQMKPGDPIDVAKVEKTFLLEGDRAHAEELLANAPYALVDAVDEAVTQAQLGLGRDLGRSLPVAIIDHLQFVLQRLSDGIRIPTAPMPELGVLYPEEYRTAEAMVARLSGDLEVDLPDEEKVFLTMHLLNATQDAPNGTAALLFRRVQHIVGTVEDFFEVELDTESPDYARFILHVKFLLQRLVSGSMLEGGDTSFYEFARKSYPQAAECSDAVAEYIRAASDSELTDEERLYIIVHVERLTQRVASSDSR